MLIFCSKLIILGANLVEIVEETVSICLDDKFFLFKASILYSAPV